jgi:chromosome partitioning protein
MEVRMEAERSKAEARAAIGRTALQLATAESFLSTKEVARRLGVDTKTVLRYIRQGKIRAVKLGRDYRIAESSLQALLGVGSAQPAEETGSRALVTAIVNQKGGVGKTTTTFNLGVALHRLGRRVLLVDLDPQASLSISAGINVGTLSLSVYQVLLDEELDPFTVIRKTSSGVDILPATIDLAAAEIELVNVTLRELVLRDVLEKIRPHYDHILIDCPPSLGLLTVNALAAADRVIIPMQCEFLATRGLALLLRTLSKIQGRLNRNLRVAGILPTMFDSRTTHAREILDELKATFPGQVFDITVKHTVRVKESPAAGLPIMDYDRDSDASQAYMRLAAEVDSA